MRFSRSPLSPFIIMLVIAALPLTAIANSVGRPSGGGAAIDWPVAINGYEKVRLTVVSPAGEVYVKDFTPGRTPSFALSDLGGDVEEGTYTYELRVEPRIAASVRQQLAKARAAGDDAAAKRIMRAAGLGDPIVQSGGFTIANGSIVSPEGVEEDSNDNVAARNVTTDGVQTTVTTNRPSLTPETQDVVYNDDLIVTGSACIGFDCVNGESFGFDTIRLKENNLRIKFEDTSATAGFPTTDWELTANDSNSGGANKFSITDVTAGTVPFTATGSAPTHSLFISSTGRIGNRTSTPVLDFHLATTNTPGIRLEQTNAGGFTAQTWDIAGNEANFFVRDVTGGSRLPFRIRPGAPTSSIDINASGSIGMGTTSPQRALHLITTAAGGTSSREQNLSSTGFTGTEYVDHTGAIDLFVGIDNANNQTRINSMNSSPIVFFLDGVEKMRVNTTGIAITGDMSATGTKSFAQVDPGDAGKAIYYAALEGPEAGTYYRGTAKTVDGEVTIDLPGFFSRLTENENMTVQLTPVGAPGQLYVASKTPEKLVIKVADGSSDLEFDYFVQGIRKGYKDFKVERPNDITRR